MAVKTLMLHGSCSLSVVFDVVATSLASRLETKELKDFGEMYSRIAFTYSTVYSIF